MKKTKGTLRFVAVCAALCMALTACSLPWDGFGGSGNTSNNRRLINFGSIQYSRPDVEALKGLIVESTREVEAAGSFQEMLYGSSIADDAWAEFSTMYTYVNIQTYLNVNDRFYEEEFRFLDDAYVELSLLNDDLIRAMVEGPYGEEYRAYVGNFIFEYLERSLLLSSPLIEELELERNALVTDYQQLVTNATLEDGGRVYTLEDILALDSYTELYRLYAAFYAENAPEFAAMYARLIAIDREKAEILGFASAAEMHYTSYNRDYGPAEALELAHNCRDELGGLVGYVLFTSSYNAEIPLSSLLGTMPGILEEIEPELLRAWNDMMDYELYDYTVSPDKMDVGFTTYISGYDAPFTYVYYTDDFSSATTVVHEFGHFYDYWLRYNSSTVQNLDVAEIYSQGLEVLCQPYFEDITGSNNADQARRSNLGGLLQGLVYQSLLEEFQLRAYELDSIDAASLAALYTELQEDYGFGDYVLGDENGLDHSWWRITHFFEAPFYTISYTTSASVALQFWALAQEDYDAAVGSYMRLIHADQNQEFLTLLDKAGLASPFERASIVTIGGYYREVFGLEADYGRAA